MPFNFLCKTPTYIQQKPQNFAGKQFPVHRIANELSSLQHVYNPVAKETILAATATAKKPESPKTNPGEKTSAKKTGKPVVQNLIEETNVKAKEAKETKTKGKSKKKKERVGSAVEAQIEKDAILITKKIKAQINQSEIANIAKISEPQNSKTVGIKKATEKAVKEAAKEKATAEKAAKKKMKDEKAAKKKLRRQKKAKGKAKRQIRKQKKGLKLKKLPS